MRPLFVLLLALTAACSGPAFQAIGPAGAEASALPVDPSGSTSDAAPLSLLSSDATGPLFEAGPSGAMKPEPAEAASEASPSSPSDASVPPDASAPDGAPCCLYRTPACPWPLCT